MAAVVDYDQTRVGQITRKAFSEAQWNYTVLAPPNHQSRDINRLEARYIARKATHFDQACRLDQGLSSFPAPEVSDVLARQGIGGKGTKWPGENFDEKWKVDGKSSKRGVRRISTKNGKSCGYATTSMRHSDLTRDANSSLFLSNAIRIIAPPKEVPTKVSFFKSFITMKSVNASAKCSNVYRKCTGAGDFATPRQIDRIKLKTSRSPSHTRFQMNLFEPKPCTKTAGSPVPPLATARLLASNLIFLTFLTGSHLKFAT